jgi:glycosyltransferase involved in cell wall biosynthesis
MRNNAEAMATNINGSILYIGGFELPDKNAAAQRVLSNAKLFRQLGYDVILWGIHKHIDNKLHSHLRKGSVAGFDHYSCPYPQSTSQWISYICQTPAIKYLIDIKSIKFIICYNYPSIALLRLIRFSKKNDIKILADCTEWYQAKSGGILVKAAKNMDSAFRMMFVHKMLDGVISISRYLNDYYMKSCKSICIPPLVDLEDKKWDQSFVPAESFNGMEFVYAGSPGQYKDKLNLVIEALTNQQNKKYVFNIIGLEKEEYLANHPEHEAIMASNTHIIFHGRLSHTDSIGFIKRAHFSVFLRERDLVTMAGFPTKFVESISAGTPVITNKTSNIEDYLFSGKNGYFVSDISINALTGEFEKIINLPNSTVQNMKDYCRKSRAFDYKSYVNALKEYLYKI